MKTLVAAILASLAIAGTAQAQTPMQHARASLQARILPVVFAQSYRLTTRCETKPGRSYRCDFGGWTSSLTKPGDTAKTIRMSLLVGFQQALFTAPQDGFSAACSTPGDGLYRCSFHGWTLGLLP
jgi:hypothetical protein